MAVLGQRFDALENNTFEARIARGLATERRFEEWLARRGFRVRHIPHQGHEPDLYTPEIDTRWQVKDGLRSAGYGTVIGEVASIDYAMDLQREGKNVAVVWEMPGGEWRGQLPLELHIRGTINDDSRRHGSGTPGYKILKGNLIEPNEIVQLIEAANARQLGLPW
jgi:hypothetical protein